MRRIANRQDGWRGMRTTRGEAKVVHIVHWNSEVVRTNTFIKLSSDINSALYLTSSEGEVLGFELRLSPLLLDPCPQPFLL
jgi:hypothetical protein